MSSLCGTIRDKQSAFIVMVVSDILTSDIYRA